MIKKFKEFIEKNELIKKGDGVVVGLSGGPDSVCLLHLLHSIKEEYDLKIVGAHINHMIRGEEANKDEEYAKELCKSLGLDFHSIRVDIEGLAKKEGVSTETAGRDVRYGFFQKIRKEYGYNKIATAHNANDQAETILMRIMRGTGIEGLLGIPVKRDGVFIRPILGIERNDIEEYCEKNKLNPRIDKTNLETIYSRNRIRLDILPYMKEHFNEDIVNTINRMSEILSFDNDFINKEVEKEYKEKCIEKEERIIIKKELFLGDKAIITRVIRKSLTNVSKSIYDFELKHINDVISLNNIGTNKRIDLPNGIIAENIYGDIEIKKKEALDKSFKKEETEIIIEKKDIDKEELEYLGYNFKFQVLKDAKKLKFNNNDLIKYFDYDKLNKCVILRARKNGDKIVPFGMKGSKKLKDIFINMKVPKNQRDITPILQFDDNIAWVVDVKLSDIFKVTKDTKTILKVICEKRG